jgi:hypothetical protein
MTCSRAPRNGKPSAASARPRRPARRLLALSRPSRRRSSASQALLATPVGAATAAKEAGQAFFEIQLQVGAHTGSAGFGTADGRRTTSSSAATLGEIEKVGWRLEHAGYYFMITGETSTARVFVSGDATAVSGLTVGVYLFRSTALPESAA